MSTLEAGKNPRDTILKPAVTKKFSIPMGEDKYTFKVDPRANKVEIKITIEAIFGVKISQVATQNRKGRTYRTRTGQGKRKDVKRAIITLREGATGISGDQA